MANALATTYTCCPCHGTALGHSKWQTRWPQRTRKPRTACNQDAYLPKRRICNAMLLAESTARATCRYIAMSGGISRCVVHGSPRSLPHNRPHGHQFWGLASRFGLCVHLKGVLVPVNSGHYRLAGFGVCPEVLHAGCVLAHHGDEGVAFARELLHRGAGAKEGVSYKDGVGWKLGCPHGHKLPGIEVAGATTMQSEDTPASSAKV